jgi:pimeloyl-ACP methyl ester carboxylesterase
MTASKEVTHRKYQERTFFHTYNQRRIFAVEYIPCEGNIRRHGVILCKPIWGERIRTHRIFTNLARDLAAKGFHVLTCDYFGDGNSAGDSTELEIPGMVSDIADLSGYLTKNYELETNTLVGMLIGGNVAWLCGNIIEKLKKIILIQPLLNPIEHLETALRSNLSSQMVVHKKVIKDRTALIDEIKSGIAVNVDGFMLGKKMWESYARISPFGEQTYEFGESVSILSLKKKGSKGLDYTSLQKKYTKVRIIELEQEIVWTDWKIYKPKPQILFQTLSNEIE